MSSPKVQQLIQKLAKDLPHRSETRGWTGRFWISWAACFLLTALVTWYTAYRWPQRSYLPSDLADPMFWGEALIWALASVASAMCAYQASFPVWPKSQAKTFAGSLIFALFAYTLAKGGAGSFASEIGADRGDCGIFILLFGSLSAIWMVSVMRKAAPTRLVEAGAWAAASSGCIGGTFMHLVCRQENVAHLLVWHFAPIALLVGAGAIAARKVLSW
jgi:hypothetical protein